VKNLAAPVLLGLMTVVVWGCGDGDGGGRATDGRLPVFVSILPQAFFVERVGGDRVRVDVLVQPGQSPATYSPTPRQLADLARARALFSAGVPFEAGLLPRVRASLPGLRVVDTLSGIEVRTMAAGHQCDGHGDHRHDHGAGDPHVWLDPMLVKRQARTIRDALGELDPKGQAGFEANCAAFEKELDALHAELTAALAPLRGREIFVFHPAYGYFCAAYGLKQVAVEVEGKAPGARQLARLIDSAQQRGVRVIFVQPQFSRKSARSVAAAIGGAVVDMDPLARDYLANMREMASRIKAALK
jgi:zinc transport system substrate-binding protein